MGELEDRLADKLLDVDVVAIHGDQDKHKKFAYTKLFTASTTMKNYFPCVLCATAAVNTGIDQALVIWVLTIGLHRYLTTLLQERGRNRAEGIYMILSDWKLIIKLVITMLVPRDASKSDELPDYEYVNAMITNRMPEREAKAAHKWAVREQGQEGPNTQQPTVASCPLSALLGTPSFLASG